VGILTKDSILAAVDLKRETVPVPEWGGDVVVQELCGTDRDAFETSLFKGEGEARVFVTENMRARLVVRCLVDGEGKRLFSDADAAALGAKNAAVIDRLYDVAQRLSGLGQKALGNAVKN
jgi:hypothetical protein